MLDIVFTIQQNPLQLERADLRVGMDLRNIQLGINVMQEDTTVCENSLYVDRNSIYMQSMQMPW